MPISHSDTHWSYIRFGAKKTWLFFPWLMSSERMVASFCCPLKLPGRPIPFAFPCVFKGDVTSSWPRSRRLMVRDWSWVPGSLRKWCLSEPKNWIPEALGATGAAACLLDQCPKQHHCYQPSPWDWLQVGLWRESFQCSEGIIAITPLIRSRLGWFFDNSQATVFL